MFILEAIANWYLAIAAFVGIADPNPVEFHGDTYTITENSIVDQDGNVTEWLPEYEEDDPRFDCKTMGNHKCGFQDPNTGEWYVVEYFFI